MAVRYVGLFQNILKPTIKTIHKLKYMRNIFVLFPDYFLCFETDLLLFNLKFLLNNVFNICRNLLFLIFE